MISLIVKSNGGWVVILQHNHSNNKIEQTSMEGILSSLEDFILNDDQFQQLARTYTFVYREFSSLVDLCMIKWSKKKQTWSFKEYICHDETKPLPKLKKHHFLLNLKISGYNWGTLFAEMEKRFNSSLQKTMDVDEIEEFMEERPDEYSNMRDNYFASYKETIIDNWFTYDKQSLSEYISQSQSRLRDYILNRNLTI